MHFPYDKVSSLEDIAALKESSDLECKKAQGRTGKGQIPKSFWETYSAFANTDGGEVFLGVDREKRRLFCFGRFV